MPTWTIKAHDKEGNIEIIGVQAHTADEALRLAEVDPESVDAVKKQSGDWDPWHQQVIDNIRSFVYIGVVIYVVWIFFVLPGSWLSFSEMGIVGKVFVGAMGGLIGVLMVALLLKGAIGLFRHRKRDSSEAKVLNRTTIENTTMNQFAKLTMLCVSVGAVVCAIYVILLLRSDEPVKPYLILLPLLFVHFGSQTYEE